MCLDEGGVATGDSCLHTSVPLLLQGTARLPLRLACLKDTLEACFEWVCLDEGGVATGDGCLHTSIPLLLQGTARLPLRLVLMGACSKDTLEVMEASMLPVEELVGGLHLVWRQGWGVKDNEATPL